MNNKRKWIVWTVLLLVLTNAGSFFLGNKFSAYSLATSIGKGGSNGASTISNADISKFKKLFVVRNKLYQYYDGNIDDNALVEGAIKGMTNALNDPYTVYMNQKEYGDFNATIVGSYAGVGLYISVKDNNIVVVKPIDGSPAATAGILPGDIIEKVNGTALTAKDSDRASVLMKGKEGTNVVLTLSRAGKGIFNVTLTRAKITINTVTSEMLPNNIGYINISTFDENTGKNFNAALSSLKSKNMQGLILDLRDDPGGALDQCVDVVSNFIPAGKVIVSTIDKYGNKSSYNSKGGMAVGLPLVILTNGNTASASEIVSGAIRDYKLGTLVGEKTFGKGVVQTIFSNTAEGFGDGSALKVTIAKYYTPSGENIQGKGIQPDVKVQYPKDLLGKPYNRSLDPQFAKALEIIKSKIK